MFIINRLRLTPANGRVFFKKAVCDVGSLWEVAAARI